MTRPSPEAERALVEARDARASTEAILPLVEGLSLRVREQVEANHFLDLIEGILRASKTSIIAKV